MRRPLLGKERGEARCDVGIADSYLESFFFGIILVCFHTYSMGVPGLAGWLIRRYPWILSAVSDGESAEDDDGVQAHCDEVRCRSFAEECSASALSRAPAFLRPSS